jgi:hypothetical protein
MGPGDVPVERIDVTVQKTHGWLGEIAAASHLNKNRHAGLVAGHILIKLAVGAIPIIIGWALGVVVVAAFVGGYLAALR